MGCNNCVERAICRDAFIRGCNRCNMYDDEIDPIQFPMERRVNQIVWAYYLGEMGMDSFENNTFQIKPYSWADYDDDDKDPNEWHFWHKPSGIRLEWYKYPLRGVRTNRRLTSEEFADILSDCHNSMEEGKRFRYLYKRRWAIESLYKQLKQNFMIIGYPEDLMIYTPLLTL